MSIEIKPLTPGNTEHFACYIDGSYNGSIYSKLANEIQRLQACERALGVAEEALTKLMAADDHGGNARLERDGGYYAFDEPNAVQVSRDALTAIAAATKAGGA